MYIKKLQEPVIFYSIIKIIINFLKGPCPLEILASVSPESLAVCLICSPINL